MKTSEKEINSATKLNYFNGGAASESTDREVDTLYQSIHYAQIIKLSGTNACKCSYFIFIEYEANNSKKYSRLHNIISY